MKEKDNEKEKAFFLSFGGEGEVHWKRLRLAKYYIIHVGMNTGIQDAQNLAWKLASVVKGIAPASILQTYETERRPVLPIFICFSLFTAFFLFHSLLF